MAKGNICQSPDASHTSSNFVPTRSMLSYMLPDLTYAEHQCSKLLVAVITAEGLWDQKDGLTILPETAQEIQRMGFHLTNPLLPPSLPLCLILPKKKMKTTWMMTMVSVQWWACPLVPQMWLVMEPTWILTTLVSEVADNFLGFQLVFSTCFVLNLDYFTFCLATQSWYFIFISSVYDFPCRGFVIAGFCWGLGSHVSSWTLWILSHTIFGIGLVFCHVWLYEPCALGDCILHGMLSFRLGKSVTVPGTLLPDLALCINLFTCTALVP